MAPFDALAKAFRRVFSVSGTVESSASVDGRGLLANIALICSCARTYCARRLIFIVLVGELLGQFFSKDSHQVETDVVPIQNVLRI